MTDSIVERLRDEAEKLRGYPPAYVEMATLLREAADQIVKLQSLARDVANLSLIDSDRERERAAINKARELTIWGLGDDH